MKNEKGQTLEQFLEAYDASQYENPSCTVDIVLMTVSQGILKLLLIKRKDHPWIGQWALPGGFVNMDEDLDVSAARELEEETHISQNTYFHQLYTLGNANRDPRTRIISTVYFSMTPEENLKKTKAGDDAKEAKWFTLKKEVLSLNAKERISQLSLINEEEQIEMYYEIHDKAMKNYIQTRSKILKQSNTELAADHIKAINMAMDQLKNRSTGTGYLFNLLPKEVTLREIQTVYEAIQGHKTDTGNFRRDIKKMLVETGHTKKVYGKDTKLYSFNPMFEFLEENL